MRGRQQERRARSWARTLVINSPRPDPPPPCSSLARNCVPSVNSCFKFALLRPAPLSFTVMRTVDGAAATSAATIVADAVAAESLRGSLVRAALSRETAMVTLPCSGVNWWAR